MIVLKKGKVFSKKHIVVATLAICLAAAVWLNMRFSTLPTKDTDETNGGSLEQGQYLSDETPGTAVQVSTGVTYIKQARAERDTTRETAVSDIKTTVEKTDTDDKTKKEALQTVAKITENAQKEVNVETVIKAKGFEDALVMIADDSVTVIVPTDSLLGSQTLQIQDAVTSQMDIDLEKIKIISVK